jgi:hypothetical protein
MQAFGNSARRPPNGLQAVWCDDGGKGRGEQGDEGFK